MANTVTCKCGAVYSEKKFKLIARDKDSAECGFCSATINSWSGGVMYSYTLISKPVKCLACDGSGLVDAIHAKHFQQDNDSACKNCNGTGFLPATE